MQIIRMNRNSGIGGRKHDLTNTTGKGDKRSLAQKEKDFLDAQGDYFRSRDRGEKVAPQYKKQMDKELAALKNR